MRIKVAYSVRKLLSSHLVVAEGVDRENLNVCRI